MVLLLAPFHCLVGAAFACVVYRYFDLRNMLDLGATLSAASFAIAWGLVRNRPWTIWIQLAVCLMLFWLYADGVALLRESEMIGQWYQLSAAPYIGFVGGDGFFGFGIALCLAELGSLVLQYMARAEKTNPEPLRNFLPTPGEIYLSAVFLAAIIYCDLYSPSLVNKAFWDRQVAIDEERRQQLENSKAQARAMEEYQRSGKAEQFAREERARRVEAERNPPAAPPGTPEIGRGPIPFRTPYQGPQSMQQEAQRVFGELQKHRENESAGNSQPNQPPQLGGPPGQPK